MKTTSYNQLNINQKINLRSGFDVAVAKESGKYNRYKQCISISAINEECCNNVYNIDRFYISLRTTMKH